MAWIVADLYFLWCSCALNVVYFEVELPLNPMRKAL